MLYLYNIYNCYTDNDIGTDDDTISDHVQAEKKQTAQTQYSNCKSNCNCNVTVIVIVILILILILVLILVQS